GVRNGSAAQLLLERPVHSLDLPTGPRMAWLGQLRFDAVMLIGPQEGMAAQHRGGAFAVLWQIGKLDPVVGQDEIDLVRNSLHQSIEKGDRGCSISFLDESGKGDFRGPVNGDEEVKLAFLCPDLENVDVEEAGQIGLELFL